MHERRKKGLCYTCDEPFVLGHKCKTIQVFMLREEKEEEAGKEQPTVEEEGEVLELEELEVSIHALEGGGAPRTMRLIGKVGDRRISILVDSESTHNFMNNEVAAQLAFKPHTHAGFKVLVADGSKLQCTGVLREDPMENQGFHFNTNFYLLPIKGSDVILRVQWLKQLGVVTTDWGKMTMQFDYKGKEHVLVGNKKPTFDNISVKVMQRCLEDEWPMSMVFTISGEATSKGEVPSELAGTLEKFKVVFEAPKGLPPIRACDHQIVMKGDSLKEEEKT